MSSSINGILNTARSAILANQTGVRVASQNIANANTEGYTRQTLRLVESRPDQTPIGPLGTGVSVYGVERIRDELLDVTYRHEAGKADGYAARRDALGRIEAVLGEPSDNGLAASLDAFWASWSDLAIRPDNSAARRTVQHHGEQVASTLNSLDRRFTEVARQTRDQLTASVQSVNEFAKQVAQLNQEIVRAEAAGGEALNLRDQRDLLVDRLSQQGNVRTLDRGNGSIAVMLENSMLVDGGNAKTVAATGEPPSVRVNGVPVSFAPDGGRLGELTRVLNQDLPAARARLDTLASAVVAQVNALHTSGYESDGTAGGAFFDPAGTTAASISLSAAVAADPARIVTTDDAAQPSGNRIALAMGGLRNRPADNESAQGIAAWTAVSGGLAGSSFGEYYEDVVAEIALGVSAAKHGANVYRGIAEQVDARRQSVSGVSTDEELIKMMSFQQAYTAATKVVTTVDEMLQAVLNMV